MIYAEHLKKEFKKVIKEPGLKGSFKALFKPKKEIVTAVDNISFHVRYLDLSDPMVQVNQQLSKCLQVS